MSISRDNLGVLYHCFRSSCKNSSGFLPDITLEYIPKKVFTPKPYSYPLLPVINEQKQFLLDKGFTEEEIARHIKYNSTRNTYVYDIKDMQARIVGYVDRDYSSRRDVKAITYWFNDVPKIHFVEPVTKSNPSILIVEDIPSAIKAQRYVQSVALLGSYISMEQAQLLRKITDTVYLALDEDATRTAVMLQKRYGFYFKNFIVLPLSNKDIKDMDDTELKQFAERLNAS